MRKIMLATGLFLLSACSANEATSHEAEETVNVVSTETVSFEENENFKALEASIDHYLTEQAFNGVALVATGDNIILNKGYGYADVQSNSLNETNTIYHIASVSKSFVAVSILQLVEAGKLSLNTTIDNFFPDLPNGESITIHHLLTHTSGLYDTFTYEGYEFETTVEQLIAPAFSENNLYFDTIGEDAIYSNVGYDILGAIVEIVTGFPYEVYIDEYIFKPLGMNDSMLNINADVIDNMATPYSGDISDGIVAKTMHPSFGYSAGGLHSTVEDLYLYDRALANHTLINQESYDLMVSHYADVEGSKYGYGWWLGSEFEGLISHPGNLLGWHSMMIRHNDDDVTVILLTNHDKSDMNMGYTITRMVLANTEDGELIDVQ